MLYADLVQQARVFMGHSCIGEHECVSCGLSDRANERTADVLKVNFVNFDELMLGKGNYICDSCLSIIDDKDMRFSSVFFVSPGQKQIPDRSEILGILKAPPQKFVLSVPYSFKKHHWLYAGMSSDKMALIGTDNRTVKLDYSEHNIPDAIDTVQQLIQAGIPRKEIISGKYSTFSRYKVADIEERDNTLKPLRQGGAIELFVRYSPAINQKIELRSDAALITESEQRAAEVIYSVAARSQYRANDGIRFWGGFLESRINRFKNLPLHEFVSRLSAAVGAPLIFTPSISDLTEEQEDEVMGDIRRETTLIVSLAYDIVKEAKKNV